MNATILGWLLGGEPGSAGRLVWTAPDWVVVVGVGLGLLALAGALRGRRSGGALALEVGLWALALAGLVAAVARPVWLEEEGRTEPGRVAVLVDASSSMGVLEEGLSRADQALAVLEGLPEDVEVFHFGDELAAGPPGAFDLPGTDLESALAALSDRFAGEDLAAVAVITDGLDRGLLRQRWLRGENPVAPEIPGPLTLYQVGEVRGVKDLSVRWVDAGGYAYVHTPFAVRAEIVGLGFEGRTVPVELLEDGATRARREVTLDDEGKAEVEFEVTPDRAGRFSYLVQVPTFDDDAVPANNVLPVVVRVVRDKLRVLQVAGAPSWDVKFLRRFLKGDPSVDLVSFFILRTKRDLARRWGDRELSLIQFPYEELFTEDLLTFDLVVFQNFDYRPYFDRRSSLLLDNLRKFVVDQGHGFVMVGGDRSFSLGAYGDTPLGDVLPVTVDPEPVDADPTPFQPELTGAGERHPVTRLVSDPVENAEWWSRLHTLDGTNTGLTARPDAAVLLTHPELKDGNGAPLPVLSVREVGKGRTMALTVDASWRWSLSEAAEGRGNQAYLRFWKNAMRWLVSDPTTRRVDVDTPRENYRLGDDVRISVVARDADFSPLADAEVDVVVRRGAVTTELSATTGPDGEAVLNVPADGRGAHRIEATVRLGNGRVGTASTVYAVTSRDPELDEVAPDGAFLQWLAERAEGRYHPPGEAGPLLEDPDAGRTVWDRSEVAVWRSPLLALWIGLFAGLAWTVRRRAGLR